MNYGATLSSNPKIVSKKFWGGHAVLALLMITQILSFLDRVVLGLLVKPIRADLQISDTQMGLLFGAVFAVPYVLASLPIGWAADRYRRLTLISAGICVWSLGTFCSAFADSFGSLAAARGIVGIGEAVLVPCAYSLIADIYPRKTLGKAMAIFIAGTPVGIGIALVMGGGLYTSIEGLLIGGIIPDFGFKAWQLTFAIVGLPGLFLAAILYLQTEPERKEIVTVPNDNIVSETENRRLRWITLGFIALGFAMLSLPLQSMQVWGVQHFVRAMAVPLDQASFMIGWPVAIFGALGALSGGFFTDRMAGKWNDGTLRLGLIAAAIYLPFASMVTLLPSVALAQMALLPMAFCAMLPFSAGTYSIMMIAPAGMRSRCLAIFSIAINLLGVGVSPVLTGAINDYIVQDEAKVGISVAIVGIFACMLSFTLISIGRPLFARAVPIASDPKQ